MKEPLINNISKLLKKNKMIIRNVLYEKIKYDTKTIQSNVKYSSKGHACSFSVCFSSRMYLFIQMEFCEGGTLTTWIRARNRMNKQRIAVEIHKIFYEIVSGVEYIHSNSLIHRDLKVFVFSCYCVLTYKQISIFPIFSHLYFSFSLITYCLAWMAK